MRFAAAVVVFGVAMSQALAQTVLLGEQVKSGEHFRCELELGVSGKLKAERGGRLEAMEISASAIHKYFERAEFADSAGGIGKSVRYYETATSTTKAGNETTKRELPENRRLCVVVREPEGTVPFSPAGPLRRDDLELIGEHFDTMAVPILLPNKELKVGDTWNLSNDATQHACLFEGVTKNELKGTLLEVKDGVASFHIGGLAAGVELGASARVSVSATGKFDTTAKRITELVWEQTDDRDAGPVTPATEVKAKITMKRSALAEEPKQLSSEARAKVPETKIPPEMLLLVYEDPKGRYRFTHSREWRVIGYTEEHLILRLLEKNQFLAQITLSSWKKAEPGKHTEGADFKRAVQDLKDWEPESVGQEGEVPAQKDHWMYRIAMKGKQAGVDVTQTFYLLAGPNGDQIAMSVLQGTEKTEKLKARDVELLKTLEFLKK